MKRIGPHVSVAGGVFNAPVNARAVGATAFGLFTKNQRQWAAKPFDTATIDAFFKSMETNGFLPQHVLPHDSYLINIGNPDSAIREKSLLSFIEELTRCDQLGLTLLNMHPGSHLSVISEDECLKLISESINIALDKTKNVTVVLETTAGQGSNVGYKFEHIAAIINKVEDKSRIGFCIDTCHIFAAGYDIRTKESYGTVMNTLNSIVGFQYLRGVHLNDSKTDISSNVDRHHSIAKGLIGISAFEFLMNDKRFDEVPMILETIDETLWPEEIKLLYSLEK